MAAAPASENLLAQTALFATVAQGETSAAPNQVWSRSAGHVIGILLMSHLGPHPNGPPGWGRTALGSASQKDDHLVTDGDQIRSNQMFVRYEAHIESPYSDALEVFASPARSWVPDLAVDPGGGNTFVRSELGTALVAKEVKMYTREAFVRSDRAVIPLRVVASGPSGLFPELDADLELLPDGNDGCKLVLQGSYRLPLGHVGELLDRKLLHGLRDASLKNFVRRVANILGERPVQEARRASRTP